MKRSLVVIWALAMGLIFSLALVGIIQVQETKSAGLAEERVLQPGGDLLDSDRAAVITATSGLTNYLPLLSKPPGPFTCNDVVISFIPRKTTYNAGESVDIIVAGARPADGSPQLQWARSSANTQLGDAVWTTIDLTWRPSEMAYRATWNITDTISGSSPYHESKNQEFIIAFTLWDGVGNYLCAGDPDPGGVDIHPELLSAMCDNCNQVLVTRDLPLGATTSLTNFWNVEPGYSLTYLGDRLDDPEDDNGVPINVSFETRMEYEAPVTLCDIPLIPQRFTKNSRWGYWNPSAPKPEDRNGSIWTEGDTNLRFFLTDSRYAYSWEDDIRGSYAHKIYQIGNSSYELSNLGDTLNRTIIHTSDNHENYSYPPYLLSYSAVPDSGQDQFARVDSIYDHFTESPGTLCQTQTPREDHDWYTYARFLTDSELGSEFDTIQSYFSDTKDIVVLTFFEGGSYSGGRPILREDWYLMEDMGLVGIDMARWDQNDTTTAALYLDTPFMKEGTPAKPQVRIRADRGYTGGALEITAVEPGTSFPMTVTAGSCYTIALHSITPGSMPYDGRLEHDSNNAATLWTKAIGGEPHWADDGILVECLPAGFPSGEYKVRLRPHITKSPSNNETALNYIEMPWSTNHLWIIVP